MNIYEKMMAIRTGNLSLRALITLLLGFLMFQIVLIYSVTGIQRLKKITLDELDTKLLVVADMAEHYLPDQYHDRIEDKDSIPLPEYQQIVHGYDELCQKHGLEYIWSLLLLDEKV